jgi:hypothetical protein
MSDLPTDSDLFNANLVDAVLSDVQRSIQARLRACPWFSPINILYTQQGDLVNELDISLGTMAKGYGAGLCVVVGTPNADDSTDNVAALDLDPFYVACDVYCDMLTVDGPTGVRKSVDGVALNVLRLLKGWTPLGFNGPLSSSKPTIFNVPDSTGSGIVIRRVALRGALTLPVLRLDGEGLFPIAT